MRVKIISGPEGGAQGTRILMPNGTDLSEIVTAVKLEAAVGGQWKATIECACEVEVEAELEQKLVEHSVGVKEWVVCDSCKTPPDCKNNGCMEDRFI